MCKQCKQERAANWFAIARDNLSGRRSCCRSGSNADTGLSWHVTASPHITAIPAHPPLTCSMPHPLTCQGHTRTLFQHVFNINSTAGNRLGKAACRACASENNRERRAAMRKTSSALPSEKKCRKCNEVRPMPSLYTVIFRYVCSPFGQKGSKMNCNAPRGHCSCCLLLDNIMNVPKVKDVSQFKVNKGIRDGLESYCHECHKAVNDAYDRGRLAPAESAVHPLKRCANCGEVSHRLSCMMS